MKRLLLFLKLLLFSALLSGQAVINLDPSSLGALDALMTLTGIRIYVSVLNTTGVETGTIVYPYNTIQEAQAVCTGGEVILVYPGTYTETVTFAVNNVAIVGVGRPEEIIITQADANVIDFATTTGGSISNVTISLTAPTDATKDAISITGPGTAEIRFCDLSLATASTISSADQPYIANLVYSVTGIAELKILHGNVTYAHTGTTTTGVKVPFYSGAGNLLELDGIHMIDINNSGTAAATSIFTAASSGSVFMHHSHADVDDDDATSTAGLGYLVASGTTIEYAYNDIHVHGDANNVYGIYITDPTVRLSYNHIHVEISGAGAAYALMEAGTGTIISQFDDIISVHGSSGNIVQLNSPADGALFSTGTYDQTIVNTVAGGETGHYAYIHHITNALTGELIGVRGNARVGIESAAGTAIGGKFQVGNLDGAGFGLAGATGVYVDVVNKEPAAVSVTWTNARGYEVSMDLNQGASGHVNVVTNAAMFYGVYNLPTVGTYSTVTNGYGVFLRNEAVGGTGQALDAAFYVDDRNIGGAVHGWDYGIDFSGIGANSGNFGTADIRLANSETIDNTTDGTINLTVPASATVPGLTFNADVNTGINAAAGDQLSIMAGGIEIGSFIYSNTDAQLILDAGVTASATRPSLAFGDGNSGFYESADNTIEVSTGGNSRALFNANGLFKTGWDGFSLFTVTATSTVPAVGVNALDGNTGMGRAGDDSLSLIAGGVEGIRIAEGGGKIWTILTDTTIIEEALIPDVSQGADIGISSHPFNLVYADSVHANWFGGSYATFDADTIEFASGANISNAETDTLFFTEVVTKVTGNLVVTGNLEVAGTESKYADMYLNANGNPTTMETADTPIGIRYFTTGDQNGFTFNAGGTGAITAYADYGVAAGDTVTVTDNGHGLTDGDFIVIRGTTNYNGVWQIGYIGVNSFYIVDTWVADDGASDWEEPSYLQLTAGANETFDIAWYLSSQKAGGASATVQWCAYKNTTPLNKTIAQRELPGTDIGSVSGGGLVPSVSAGDRFFMIIQSDNTNDITNRYGALILIQE